MVFQREGVEKIPFQLTFSSTSDKQRKILYGLVLLCSSAQVTMNLLVLIKTNVFKRNSEEEKQKGPSLLFAVTENYQYIAGNT